MKPTQAQRKYLALLAAAPTHLCRRPSFVQERTVLICVERGWARFGDNRNVARITDAGRAALEQQP